MCLYIGANPLLVTRIQVLSIDENFCEFQILSPIDDRKIHLVKCSSRYGSSIRYLSNYILYIMVSCSSNYWKETIDKERESSSNWIKWFIIIFHLHMFRIYVCNIWWFWLFTATEIFILFFNSFLWLLAGNLGRTQDRCPVQSTKDLLGPAFTAGNYYSTNWLPVCTFMQLS